MLKNLIRFSFSIFVAVGLTATSFLVASAFSGPSSSPPTEDGVMTVLDGNVGIGETTPDTKLHINSAEDTYIRVDRAGSPRAHLGDTGSGNDGMLQLYNASGIETTRIRTSGGDSWIGGGNLGIGTSSPGARLEVAGQVKITGGTPGAGKVLTSDADGLASWVDAAGTISGTGVANKIAFWTDASTLSNDTSLHWNDTSNNLGVGVASPSTSLHVDGGTNSSGGTANSGYAIIGPSTGTHLSIDNNEIMAKASGTAVSTLYINNDGGDVAFGGDVGIGTVDPGYALDVMKTPAGNSNVFRAGTSVTYPSIVVTGDTEIRSYPASGRGTYIKTYNSAGSIRTMLQSVTPSSGEPNLILVQSAGNVGIGTTTPISGTKLDIAGMTSDKRISNGEYGTNGLSSANFVGTRYAWDTDNLQIGLRDYGADRKDAVFNLEQSSDHFRFQVAGSDIMFIGGNGNVGIGTTTPGTYKLNVNGNTNITGDVNITGAVTCGSGCGGGITSLGGLTNSTQTFANDTNVTMSSAGTTHTLGWTGSLAVGRGGTGATTAATARTNLGLATVSQVAAEAGTETTTRAWTAERVAQAIAAQAGSGNVSGTGAATRVAFWSASDTLSSNANLFWDNTNSRLGVGTIGDTGARFSVHGGAGTAGFMSGLSSPNRGSLYYSTDGTGWKFNIGQLQSGTFTPQMTFVTGGNVGIGTTGPSTKLHVDGGTNSSAGTANTGYIIVGPSTGTHLSIDNNEIMAKASGTTTSDLHLNNDGGDVIIGGGSGKLDVGTVTFGSNSILEGYDSGDTDITGLVPGSGFGTLLRTQPNAHFVITLDGNDNNDSFNILSHTTTTGTGSQKPVDTKVFSVNRVGDTTIAGNLTVGSCTGCTSGGITSLNGLTASSQTFGNDTNVIMSSAGSTHSIGWTGSLAVGRGGTGSTTAASARISLGLATVSQVEAEAGTATTTRAWTAQRVKQAIDAHAGSGTVSGTGAATRVAFWSGTSTLSSNSNLYWNNTNSRLGIGIAGGSSRLHVLGTGGGDGTWSEGILVENNNATPGEPAIVFRNTTLDSNYWFVGNNQDNEFAINYGSSFVDAGNLLNILPGGNVGIGTRIPSTKLHVDGGTDSAGGTANSGYIIVGPSNGTHISIDNNEIMAKASGTTTNNLHINLDGGDVIFGGGSGKIDAGTVDPPYTIDGKGYATYLPAMTGVKEETTGIARLRSDGRYVIDFDDVSKASDLWLFAQTININARDYFDEKEDKLYSTTKEEIFENMTVLLTPNFDGKVWYEKDADKKRVTIFGTPNVGVSDAQLEVSYRITAPRFDWKSFGNQRSEKDTKGSPGFNLNELLR